MPRLLELEVGSSFSYAVSAQNSSFSRHSATGEEPLLEPLPAAAGSRGAALGATRCRERLVGMFACPCPQPTLGVYLGLNGVGLRRALPQLFCTSCLLFLPWRAQIYSCKVQKFTSSLLRGLTVVLNSIVGSSRDPSALRNTRVRTGSGQFSKSGSFVQVFKIVRHPYKEGRTSCKRAPPPPPPKAREKNPTALSPRLGPLVRGLGGHRRGAPGGSECLRRRTWSPWAFGAFGV